MWEWVCRAEPDPECFLDESSTRAIRVTHLVSNSLPRESGNTRITAVMSSDVTVRPERDLAQSEGHKATGPTN